MAIRTMRPAGDAESVLPAIVHGALAWLFACLVLAAPAAAVHAAEEAAPRVPIILAIGESTTAGFGVASHESYPGQLQSLLEARGYDYRVVNHGRSGSTSAMALAGLDRGLRLGPEIVIIALGGNDQGNRVAAERTKDNLRKLVSLFVRSGATVFLADRSGRADRAQDGPSLFAELAAEEGAILMPSLREKVAGRSGLLLADGSHPNAEGYTIVARQVFESIEPYLRSPEPSDTQDTSPVE